MNLIFEYFGVLSWLQGPEKCKLKVSYFQMFRLRLESSSVRIYFYKKYKGRNLKIARVTDKHLVFYSSCTTLKC